MTLHATAATSVPPAAAAGGNTNNSINIQYSPKITHEQFWLRVQSIPSTIQFRLTHPSSSDPAAISVADIGESQFLDGVDDKSHEVVSQLLKCSPLAARMEYEDREALIWEIIDATCDIIIDNGGGVGSAISKIWIVNVEIEQEQSGGNSGYEDGGRETQNGAGLNGVEKEADETASLCRCAICCKGIPVTWSKDYCPDKNCPSRRVEFNSNE
ncbi:unnamed protein product [Linum trigynum]|uniref:Uncharacterized protein n=1 Tax=Linum trigynum TaxID=586398 RepID=A0AAV2CV91_9ROSI